METYKDIELPIIVSPQELFLTDDFLNLLNIKYTKSIFQNIFIHHVSNILNVKGGRILHNGHVSYNVLANCFIINSDIGKQYKIPITNVNKMGAMYKNEKFTIFIPVNYFNGISVNINDYYYVSILGKRIEDSIVCVGSIVS